jgi:integrase
MCVCFGLRISEALALKWADVDWLNGTLRVERGIVQQVVDDVKTYESRKTLTISDDLLNVLKAWKQAAQFSANEDWIFASPVQVGRLPYSYSGVKQEIQRAADAASLGHLRSHAFRHTYRTWLDSVSTPVGVQQRLMRHADIPHNHEHLWGRCDAGHARSPRQDCGYCAQRHGNCTEGFLSYWNCTEGFLSY